MSFGGTVPVGNLIFGPAVDCFGARSVLMLGAVLALSLAWWTALVRVGPTPAFLIE